MSELDDFKRSETTAIVDALRSELKRWGDRKEPDLLVLALVLSRREKDRFRATFGDEGRETLQQRLGMGESVGRVSDVADLLDHIEKGGAPADLVDLVHERLPATATAAPTTASASHPFASRPHRMGSVVVGAPVSGRDDLLDEVMSRLARRHPRVVVVSCESGGGRSTLAVGLAARLTEDCCPSTLANRPVVALNNELALVEGAAQSLRRLVDELEEAVVLVIDDLDMLAALGSQRPVLDVLTVLRQIASRRSVPVLALISEQHLSRVQTWDEQLWQLVDILRMEELSGDVLLEILNREVPALEEHHSVSISADVVSLAAAPRLPTDNRMHPGLGLDRLDLAAGRAAVRGMTDVQASDLGPLDAGDRIDQGAAELEVALRRRVIGQDDAVRRICRRLALTRAGLDLRPGRPDGVFLLVGPTGVGKTELAKAVCDEFFGNEDASIRLDMSEYAHDWALSRLIGPQPGYVGSTEPGSWLTTRVSERPSAVLLLDEIEKAHPSIWNAFLQVFDAGRLSDSRGTVADLSQVVVFMTSNLGSGRDAGRSLGFNPSASSRRSDVVAAVEQAMAPELVNRLDAMLVFDPLTDEALSAIARKEVNAVLSRLRSRGFDLQVDDAVVDLIASAGSDARYGARHLQRNIEQMLLETLVETNGNSLRAAVLDGTVVWRRDAD